MIQLCVDSRFYMTAEPYMCELHEGDIAYIKWQVKRTEDTFDYDIVRVSILNKQYKGNTYCGCEENATWTISPEEEFYISPLLGKPGQLLMELSFENSETGMIRHTNKLCFKINSCLSSCENQAQQIWNKIIRLEDKAFTSVVIETDEETELKYYVFRNSIGEIVDKVLIESGSGGDVTLELNTAKVIPINNNAVPFMINDFGELELGELTEEYEYSLFYNKTQVQIPFSLVTQTLKSLPDTYRTIIAVQTATNEEEVPEFEFQLADLTSMSEEQISELTIIGSCFFNENMVQYYIEGLGTFTKSLEDIENYKVPYGFMKMNGNNLGFYIDTISQTVKRLQLASETATFILCDLNNSGEETEIRLINMPLILNATTSIISRHIYLRYLDESTVPATAELTLDSTNNICVGRAYKEHGIWYVTMYGLGTYNDQGDINLTNWTATIQPYDVFSCELIHDINTNTTTVTFPFKGYNEITRSAIPTIDDMVNRQQYISGTGVPGSQINIVSHSPLNGKVEEDGTWRITTVFSITSGMQISAQQIETNKEPSLIKNKVAVTNVETISWNSSIAGIVPTNGEAGNLSLIPTTTYNIEIGNVLGVRRTKLSSGAISYTPILYNALSEFLEIKENEPEGYTYMIIGNVYYDAITELPMLHLYGIGDFRVNKDYVTKEQFTELENNVDSNTTNINEINNNIDALENAITIVGQTANSSNALATQANDKADTAQNDINIIKPKVDMSIIQSSILYPEPEKVRIEFLNNVGTTQYADINWNELAPVYSIGWVLATSASITITFDVDGNISMNGITAFIGKIPQMTDITKSYLIPPLTTTFTASQVIVYNPIADTITKRAVTNGFNDGDIIIGGMSTFNGRNYVRILGLPEVVWQDTE